MMNLERINQLFEEGLITAQEHQSLVKKIYSSDKTMSRFAWASFLSALSGWLLMLKFTVNEQEYSLLAGEYRLFAGAISGTSGLVFYYLAKQEIRNKLEVGGLELAARGQAISIVILSIVVPVILIHIFHSV